MRYQSGPSLTEYGFTGQFGYTGSFGLIYFNARWLDVSLGRFAQADSIVPPGAQGLDRYSYVNNSPMNYVDPSGHICVESDGDSDVGMAGNCNGGSNPKYKPGLQGPKWNPMLGNANDEDQGGGVSFGAGTGSGVRKDNRPNPLCENLFPLSTCQQASGFVSTVVLTLDFVTAVGTATTGILAPEAYPAANKIEGLTGVYSLALTTFNDFFITGDIYFTSEPTPQLVVSSDAAVAIVFAIAGGIDPEPVGDTLINGAATTYDYYRLSGNDPVFEVHIGLGWGWWDIDNYHEYGH